MKKASLQQQILQAADIEQTYKSIYHPFMVYLNKPSTLYSRKRKSLRSYTI